MSAARSAANFRAGLSAMTDKHSTRKKKFGFSGRRRDATSRVICIRYSEPRQPFREPRADVGNSSRRIARGWTLYPPLRSPRSPVLSRAATLLAPIVGCYDKWAINFALDLARASRDPRCSLLLDALQERLLSSSPSPLSPLCPRRPSSRKRNVARFLSDDYI